IKDKRFRPKNWLELTVAFDADNAGVAGADNNLIVDSLEFKFYLVLNVRNKEGKLTMLTANETFINIVKLEEAHALMYVSPAMLVKLLQKHSFTAADVNAYGVEIYNDGASVGRYISTGPTPFWDTPDKFVVVEGALLPKVKTPFASLWGDYDVESKMQ
ncbi:MAG: Amuc_1102 family pilus-like protein, partial [Verrucomicrobiales bacterium]